MIIFLSLALLFVCYLIFKIIYRAYRKFRFNSFMNKSGFDNFITKSDLISFRHELGETIFDLQKEINELKEAVKHGNKEVDL